MATRTPFTGCGTALVTPFTTDGALDEPAITRLARRQVDAGMHFLVPCGTTGESPTLDARERRRVVELVVEAAAGRVPVMAGAGGYDTREVIHAVGEMAKAGATGILSVSPYYNRPTQEGLYQHYRAIAESTSLPVMVYNVAGRTGSNVETATLVRLAEIPNIIGVKEASGNIAQICDVRRNLPPEFLVVSGDDAITLPVMSIGGQGVISVAGNEIPGEMARLVEAIERNDWAAARALHHTFLPLMMINFVESNPIPVKTAMAKMGLLPEVFRLPMVSPSEASRRRIERVLADLDLVPAGAGAARA
ncbi:MAG: 4-hydroxy-tetrahydrodipicolinate synthase [Vicinamibacteraceae bacterium]